MADLVIRSLEDRDVDAVARLCEDEGWPNYSSAERVVAAVASVGTRSLVADMSGEVVGFAHLQGDGPVGAHLTLLVVAPRHRRIGVARALIADCFVRSGSARIDLVTEGDAVEFYRSFEHREMVGFRLYPPS